MPTDTELLRNIDSRLKAIFILQSAQTVILINTAQAMGWIDHEQASAAFEILRESEMAMADITGE